MALCTASAIARNGVVTRITCKDQTRAWEKWCKFTKQIEYEHDEILDELPKLAISYLLSCFVQAEREASCSYKSRTRVVTGSVRSTVDNVAKTFRDYGRSDPRLDCDGKVARILSKQYTGYKNQDPPEKQQKAIPACVIKTICENRATELSRVIGDLSVIALFFAMRS